jgi:hypothetical protein
LYIVQDEILWLIETAKKNGVSKEDFLLWYKENQQQAGENNVVSKKL